MLKLLIRPTQTEFEREQRSSISSIYVLFQIIIIAPIKFRPTSITTIFPVFDLTFDYMHIFAYYNASKREWDALHNLHSKINNRSCTRFKIHFIALEH